MPTSHNEASTGCLAPVWKDGKPCGRPLAPNARYCPTHHFVLEADSPAAGYATAFDLADQGTFREAMSAGLDEELGLTRMHLLRLMSSGGSHKEWLDSMRTLILVARLQTSMDKLRRRRRS